MTGPESFRKPAEEPDFSSLAEQVEEVQPPWQNAADLSDAESNATLAYTVDENFETVREISHNKQVEEYFFHGILSLIGGVVFTCVSLAIFPAGAMITTGFVWYGIALLCLSFSASSKRASLKEPVLKATAMSVNKMFTIRAAVPADEAAIHALHVHVFGQEAEAKLVDELRAEGFATISLVAVAGVRVIGHVLFSPIEIVSETSSVRALALAPLGVVPGWQRQGVGLALVREGLQQAGGAGERIVIVLGDPNYYRRFGFQPELTSALQSPYAGEYFLALELSPGALEGVTGEVRYAAPFSRLG